MTKEIIDTMMLEFKQNAFGGVFIHPRPGLITEYFSDQWWELCRYTLAKGKELDLNVWIYDENSYPSGFAGGHVPDKMPESYNQGQMLHLTKAAALPDTAELFFICLKEAGGQFENITGKIEEYKGRPGSYYLFQRENYRRSPWYGGFSYVDLMASGVTEKFIEVTMGGYEKVMGEEFGKQVPGVFTDEPNIEVQGKGNIRWTPDLFEVFQKKWGYDLRQHLPSLFEETGEWKKVRHNYYQTLLQLFIDRWSKPWYKYTEEKGLEWTGHYWEHGWPNPNHGGDNMAMYAWHQRPAIDMLFNQFNEVSPNAQFGNIRAVKELGSVVNQLGKKRTLSETYGGGGWELTFKDMKRLCDWQFVLGVNTLNQHLSFMTIKGARKYDYPPSFSYHNPWWPYYKPLNEYFARLSLALSTGKQVNKILVIEPTTSAWMYAAYGKAHPRMKEIGQVFQRFVTKLEKSQVEYDLGSENIIKDQGKANGKELLIGQAAYTTVVIPPGMENIDEDTFVLLQEYVNEGGKVFAFEHIQRIDGAEDERLSGFYREVPQLVRKDTPDQAFIRDLAEAGDIRFKRPDTSGNLYHQRRQLDDGQLLFLVNASMEETTGGQVRLKGKEVAWMDPHSGKIMQYPAEKENDEVIIDYQLPAAGSFLFYIADHVPDLPEPDIWITKREKKTVDASETTAERLRPNVLTIDFCDLAIGDTLLKDQHIYNAADTVFKYYGFKEGNPWNHSVQFKKKTVERDTFSAGTGFTASYHFEIMPGVSTGSLKTVVERPELWKVSVNGRELQPEKREWWLDKAFALFDISEVAKQGKNTLVLECSPMRVHAEIEPAYILGDFSLVSAEKGWRIVQGSPLKPGSWKAQGMPMYGHEVSYRKQFTANTRDSSYTVRLPSWKGTLAVVSVNGQKAGSIAWPPYTLDITEFIREGTNEITVKVIGSLKNTLGPHHNKPAPGLVSPWHWRNVKSYPPGDQYDLYDYGLMEDFEVLAGGKP